MPIDVTSRGAFHFATLTPDLILDALASCGFYLDSGLTPLNSYENRVYQFMAEDRQRYVVKFYRPERWSAEQLREEHELAEFLAAQDVNVAVPLSIGAQHYIIFTVLISPSGRVLADVILSLIISTNSKRWAISWGCGTPVRTSINSSIGPGSLSVTHWRSLAMS